MILLPVRWASSWTTILDQSDRGLVHPNAPPPCPARHMPAPLSPEPQPTRTRHLGHLWQDSMADHSSEIIVGLHTIGKSLGPPLVTLGPLGLSGFSQQLGAGVR